MLTLLSHPTRWRSSFWNRRTTAISPSSLRVEVIPPSLRCAPAGLWQQLLFWLLAPAPHEAAPPLHRLRGVRTDFLATLSDIDSLDADTLRRRIEQSVTLRELWHLRAEVFRIVGVARNQTEAEQRVALLNRHFPTRAPRSQFDAL